MDERTSGVCGEMAAAPLFLPLSQTFFPSLLPTRLRSLPPIHLRLPHHSGRRSAHRCPISPSSAQLSLARRRLFRNPFLLARAGEGGEPVADEARFLDDDGVVNDMDGYLNHLSLEYDSIWDTKPSWCQPWTILLTGIMVTGCSWAFLHSIIITAVTFCLICAWWFIFLYAYPKAYSDMIAQRRQNVVSGVEDTFGARKNQ